MSPLPCFRSRVGDSRRRRRSTLAGILLPPALQAIRRGPCVPWRPWRTAMALDLDTFLTAVYTIVDDLYRERLAAALRPRPGPAPSLSDSEVLALAICAEWGAWDSERGFWRFARRHLRHLFPRLVDQSEVNRRRRALYPAMAVIQRAVAERLGADLERERLLDTQPVALMVLKRHDERGLVFDGKAA